jgi:general secretion pathway protein A
MVLDYYKLAEQPFGVTPDPRFLYLGSTHREALASALYGVDAGRGFLALIAKPGMGKTTLIFDFLRKLQNTAKTVFLFQAQPSPTDLIRNLLSDLGVEEESNDLVRLQRKLNETLVAASGKNKRLVVVIDEAQNLDNAALEVVRMLSNFETPREKLMHIVLAGQPQLAERLASPELVQLRQRISMIARLKPFDEDETNLYIEHRLRVAGYDFSRPLFTKEAISLISEKSEGIPRNINNVCFNALSLGCVSKARTMDVPVIREVLDDLDLEPLFKISDRVSRSAKAKDEIAVADRKSPARLFQIGLPVRLTFLLATIVLLALMFTSHRTASQVPAAVPSESKSERVDANRPMAATVATRVLKAEPGLLPLEANQGIKRFVTVVPHQSLSQISLATIGRYDSEIRDQFLSLNPWLTDPNHIEPGQEVAIPLIESNSRIQPASEPVPVARPAEAEKP